MLSKMVKKRKVMCMDQTVAFWVVKPCTLVGEY
jgi:hypothetical protein